MIAGDVDELYILAAVLALLSIFSVSLCIGVVNHNRAFISPWLWLKYAVIALQVIRFVSVIIELAASDKNPLGASPIFELLLLGEAESFPFDWASSRFEFPVQFVCSHFVGYNVFALSIILELVEEIEPYTFKRFQYVRVWGGCVRRFSLSFLPATPETCEKYCFKNFALWHEYTLALRHDNSLSAACKKIVLSSVLWLLKRKKKTRTKPSEFASDLSESFPNYFCA